MLASPAAIRVGGQILLYYAAAGGIGLAKSADSHAFVKVPGPVPRARARRLGAGRRPPEPGRGGARRRDLPDVLRGADGPRRHARSARPRARTAPPGPAPATPRRWRPDRGLGDGGDEPWDSTSVGIAVSPARGLGGRADRRSGVVRRSAGLRPGHGTIGLAARYGIDGAALAGGERGVRDELAAGPAREPCTVAFTGFTFLYATEKSSTSDKSPVIAVGVAPATVVLPAPVAA